VATAQLTEPLALPDEDPATDVSGSSRTVRNLPLIVAAALLLIVVYAAFDHGAASPAAGARVEIAVAAVGMLAAASWLGLGGRLTASRSALAGLGLLAAFAVWSGISLIWSVAPDQTWIELNRSVAYVLVVGTAIAVGASHPRAPTLVGTGFFAVALIVAIYSLGQKLVPGLHVTGVFDLNQTGSIPRLQEPIGYWNALALFVVLGVPMALHLAADASRSRFWRLLAACGLELMLLTIAFTLSRGGLLALGVALVVAVWGARGQLRALAWLALCAVAAVPPLVLGLADHSLSGAGVPLGSRETSGAVLAAVLVGSLIVLALGGRGLMRLEPRLRLGPAVQRPARRAAVAVLVLLVAAGVVAAIATGFTSPHAPSNVNANRLLSTDSYRWLWWKEAANAFADRPLGGWGAGSFGVVHLMYRQNTLPVQQPHSLPLQFLSETGVVGALLGIGALALLAFAAARSVRRTPRRGFEVALLAAAAAYLVHCLYDWDWNIPALTIPALMFLGVLAGRGTPATAVDDALCPSFGLGTRAAGLVVATLWLGLFALSAALPSLAASKANSALIKASSSSPAALRAATADARRATSLDPLADNGLRAQALIASHQKHLARARYYLERAVEREPSDELAWEELGQVDLFLGDLAGTRQAARRVIALDPRGPSAAGIRRSGLNGGT
jgi:tetratricopeptide (TPR) repeat protein